MADKKKRYFIKTIVGNDNNGNNSLERNLLRLSTIGIKWDESLIRHMRGIGVNDTNSVDSGSFGTPLAAQEFMSKYNRMNSIVGENDYIAFYDQNYKNRRDFLRKFSMQGEIEFVLSTISDDAIVYDDANYFAYPNTKQLFSHLKPENGKKIIDNINECYKRVYNAWKFNESNDAWHYFYKFLVDGLLAFEIIYNNDPKTNQANDILCFQELDVTTLEPDTKTDTKGNTYKVWYQYKGDVARERILPDSNVIYISWTKSNFISRISYVEHLIRSFNMLRTMENSRIIWNIQNAQKQLKIVVPIGSQNEIKAKQRLDQLKAEYKEDISIDELSGEITVNGQPKFNFAKTFFFPSSENGTTEISEIGVGGHDLSNIEQLKYFWQKFILETKVPTSRFGNLLGNQVNVGIPTSDDTNTREEYTYSLFIRRARNIYKELLIKPTWNLFCIKFPEFNTNTLLKSLLGVTFTEDNLFTLAKLRKIADDGASVISNLAQIQNTDGSPYFAIKFLTEKYLGLTDDDYKLNEKYLKDEKEKYKTSENSGNTDRIGGGEFGADSGEDFGADNTPEIDADFGDDFSPEENSFSDAESDLE